MVQALLQAALVLSGLALGAIGLVKGQTALIVIGGALLVMGVAAWRRARRVRRSAGTREN
ncbi:hypothetical protein [Marilutibacter spongiae]|uniref:LPXTG cell wall anchor domain-containing protein n=1 Tax=Marilutibacter spongiae TaxID=2025720 RepID=A0A7W3Y6K6_9GAMM|nr:hypothetical protein [Lysobacter spongiae]MBB1061603.1 hypothetical protein [Lysobacter spongiae]